MRIEILDNIVKSAWEWDNNKFFINPDSFIKIAKDLNINTIYASCPNPSENLVGYDNFIKIANDQGIFVEALSGDASWVYDNGCIEAYVESILDFNASRYNKFSSIHLDVEPHCLGDIWSANKEQLMTQYVSKLSVVHRRISNYNAIYNAKVRLNVVLPRWIWSINNTDGNPVLPEIMKYVDEISVMDYTLWSSDYIANGIKFLQMANTFGVKITIGSEFIVSEPEVSLANKTISQLNSYFSEALPVFNQHKSFKQIGLHSLTFYNDYLNIAKL